MPEQQSDRTKCSRCGQTGTKKLHKCSQCHSITYCGQECQREDWERHKDNCIPVMITELRGKGRGLVASRDIEIGQVILTEEAAVTWNLGIESVMGELKDVETFIDNALHCRAEMISKQVKNMSKEKQSQFYNLRGSRHSPDSECPGRDTEIFLANRVPDEESDGGHHLFLNLSLINHSCAPNSAWSYKAASEVATSSDSSDINGKEYTELAHYLCMGAAVYGLLSDWSIFWQILSYVISLFLNVPVKYLCSGAAVCVMLEDWCFVWKILSFFLINHTYSELKSRWDSRTRISEPKKKLVLRAVKNIAKGEEITLCYLGYDQNLGSKHQMKQDLKTEFNFSCKCSVCIGVTPHQNLTKRKIRSLQDRMMRQSRKFKSPLKKKLSDWRRDALEQEKIVALTKTLYVGPIRLCREYMSLIRFAQMSRDSEILNKALEDFKDVVSIYKLEEMTKKYADTVSDVMSWSSQFKSGHQPGRGEYFHFFPCCECE